MSFLVPGSARSALSPKTNGNVALDEQFDLSKPFSHVNGQAFPKLQKDSPDELFAKYTVVEVKAFQTRLRSSPAYLQSPLTC